MSFSDRLITRKKWGGKPPKRVNAAPLMSGQQIHWTAVPSAPTGPHWPDCYEAVRNIQTYHMGVKLWNDIAYNYVVCPHGFVFEGRGWGVRNGAGGTAEANTNYLAVVSLLGPGDQVTNNYIRAIRDVVAEHVASGARDVQKPHSFFKSTSCPGDDLRRLVESGALSATHVDDTLPPPPIPLPDPVTKTPVLGVPVATQPQAVEWVLTEAEKKGSPYTPAQLRQMVDAYYRWGRQWGVRADLAIAQSAKETGKWAYGGDVKPEQFNFAGIGATGGVPGITFATIEDGVKAHVLRMRMYASSDASYYDEAILVRPLPQSIWGKYPNIQDFDGVWAVPGIGYGDSIVDDYLTPMAATVVNPTPPTLEERVADIERRLDEAGL